jgi:uncharacterized protein (DUF433 family)
LDSKKAERCGGAACVRDTRITVWGLEAYRLLGMKDSEIIAAVKGLTPADLETAWKYTAANRQEIEEDARGND